MRREYKERKEREENERKKCASDIKKVEATSVRVPLAPLNKLRIYAKAEDDSAAGLVLEGIMRVIDDRESDPEYLAALPEQYKQELIGLAESEIARLNKIAENIAELLSFQRVINGTEDSSNLT